MPRVALPVLGICVYSAAWWFYATRACLQLGGTVNALEFRCLFGASDAIPLHVAIAPDVTVWLAVIVGAATWVLGKLFGSRKGRDAQLRYRSRRIRVRVAREQDNGLHFA